MEQLEVKIRPLRLSDAATVQCYASDKRVARTTIVLSSRTNPHADSN